MTNTADSYPAPGPHRRRARKWAALAFAASVASPVALSQYSRVYAGDQPADPTAGATRAHLTGKQLYDLGVAQYRRGEWDSARQNLRQAIAAGYKPASFFQDSPTEILRRIDSREQSDRSKVQRLAQLSPAATAPANAAPDPLEALRATDEARKIRHEQAVTQANVWVKDALAARRANDNERALSLFTRAADLDPGNRAAVQGRDEVLVLLGRSPAPANLMQQEAADLEARRGEIRYRVQGNLDQARAAIAAHKWADAQIAIDRARLAASADPTIFQAQENQRFSTEIDRTELDFRKAQERVEADAQSRRDEAIQRRIQDERRRAIEERQRTIADLVRTAQLLSSEGRYAEALQTVDQILILDPINDYAVGVRPLLEDKSQFAEQRQYAELRDRKITDVLNAAEEAQVPYDDVLRYPTDWPDISDRRDRTVAAEGGASAVDRALQTSLDRKLPEVKFDGVALGDVIDFLRDVSGLNLFVNWKSLEAAGVDKNTPVTANLRDVKFSKALSVILSQSVGSGQTQLGYTVDQGVVTISTADDLAKNVQVRVYDIRDLILSVPNFNDAPQFSLDASQNGGGGGGGGGGAGGGGGGTGQTNTLFSGTGNTTAASTGPTRQDLVDAITKLVEDTVSSDSWKDNGGSTGALRELQGELIVTQTPENHRQVVALLEKLRETRALQISIEARFLIVQRNFMEDIGLDLNFLFNLNSSWSKNFGTIPLSTPSSTFTMNPTTGVQGSIGSGTTTPTGLTTSVAYLDDFQAQLMVRAVQASLNSTLVNAPRLTLFNGQRAYVLVAIQRAYVSNLTPVVTTGAASFAPTIGIVQSGVALDVEANVSADRKYVTMTLRPQLATLLDLASFQFQVPPDPNAGNGGLIIGGGNNNLITPGQTAPGGNIQEPELQITEVKTTVSVPDGGTLLIGGQTIAGQTEREIGTPVLSKIPFLKRLFTNRSMAKDEQVLLILVRPTIIVQHEVEQKQFPLLTSHIGR